MWLEQYAADGQTKVYYTFGLPQSTDLLVLQLEQKQYDHEQGEIGSIESEEYTTTDVYDLGLPVKVQNLH
jgi:hypothetical protein